MFDSQQIQSPLKSQQQKASSITKLNKHFYFQKHGQVNFWATFDRGSPWRNYKNYPGEIIKTKQPSLWLFPEYSSVVRTTSRTFLSGRNK